jgi:hypothetical protein
MQDQQRHATLLLHTPLLLCQLLHPALTPRNATAAAAVGNLLAFAAMHRAGQQPLAAAAAA